MSHCPSCGRDLQGSPTDCCGCGGFSSPLPPHDFFDQVDEKYQAWKDGERREPPDNAREMQE